MAAAAKGLAQMGVGIGILNKTKVINNRYAKSLSGYRVLTSKAASPHQGGIGLIWREDHNGFEVEAIRPLTPNLMSFQLITGNERYYIMGIYIPPNCTTGVEDLRVAWEACPADCTPLVVGDLNVRFEDLINYRADAILDLLDEINITNLSRKFLAQQCSQQWRRARWTSCMQRGREWCYSQPDYFLGNKCITKRLRRVAFRSPRFHDLDHQAVVTTFWGGSARWLKSYQRDQQRFPLKLSHGEETEQTKTFSRLVAECVKPSCASSPGMIGSWTRHRPWSDNGRPCGMSGNCRVQRGGGRNVSSGLPSAMIGGHARRALAT